MSSSRRHLRGADGHLLVLGHPSEPLRPVERPDRPDFDDVGHRVPARPDR